MHQLPQALPGHGQVALPRVHVLPTPRRVVQLPLLVQRPMDRVTGEQLVDYVAPVPVVVVAVVLQPLAVSRLFY